MLKKFFFTFFLLLSASVSIYSQQWIEEEQDFYPFSMFIQQNKNSEGHVTGYTTSIYGLGRYYDSGDHTSFISRSYHQFDISIIPDNSQIEEVRVYYSTGNNSSYSFKITKITTINTTDMGANWSAIGNGSTMDQGIAYGTNDFLSTKIKTEIGNLLSADEIILGVLSQNESANDSYSSFLIHLHVKYKYPATNYPYNATNLLKGQPGGGTVGVGLDGTPVQHNSPYNNFSAYEGQHINLQAYDNQTINNLHWLYNDNEAPLNPSKWDQDYFTVITDLGASSYVTVTAGENNGGATFRDWLKQNCEINQSYQTEFDNNQSGPTSWIVENNYGQITTPSNVQVGNNTYNYAGWEDDLSAPRENRTILPNNNETYSALYKYPHHSNTNTAYENPSQHRFVRSYNGHFHMVYESMNKVWYERSTNNGQSWEIMNGGKPVYDGIATHPSVDFYPGTDNVVIVYNKDEGEIAAQFYENGIYRCESVVSGYGSWVTDESKPVVACAYARLMVAWNEFGYIVYRLGQKISTPNHDFYWYFDPRTVNFGGDSDKNNPTIGTSKLQLLSFRLAWDANHSLIQGVNLVPINGASDISEVEFYTFSQAGFSQNYQPSISVMPNNDFRLSWFGYNDLAAEENGLKGSLPLYEKKIVTWFNYQFYIFGTNVSSHSMSATDDGRSIIAYGDNNGSSNKFRQIWYYTLDEGLGTSGKQTHLSNGSSLSNMYAMSFQNTTLPYSFSMSANLGSLQKVTEIPIACGRKGLVIGDSAEFYFTLGDVSLDGNTIDFIPTGINPDFTNLDTLNYYLSTEKFNVTNSSQFDFSIEYGVTDSLKAVQNLAENEYVKFKLQLVNANTNNVIGEYTVVTFTKDNITPYFGESFSINTSGIGNKKVRVRFVAEENINGDYAMANIHAEESVLPKQNLNIISYTGSEIITEYSLEQNYPNPFNPSTTIKFQIPTSGNVSLKIYDILGNEITTLVEEFMETGKYEINFNASSLASGVYIYRLKVNDNTNVKKMLLLK